MKALIIDSVHALIKEELSKYMQVDEHLLPKTAELAAMIGDYEVLIMRVDPAITKEVIDAAKKLKVIGVCSVGLNHVDVEAAKAAGIAVFNAPGLNSNAVAELTIAKMLDLARDTVTASNDVKVKHEWDKYKFVGRELRGNTLGIMGFGKIGRRVGALARAFGMTTIAYDPYLTQANCEGENTELLSAEELLRRVDFVTMHMPLTDETKNMIAEKQIATMKDGAIVLNMGRGGLVDEDAMYTALKSGKIGGYGADVLACELVPGGTATGFTSPLFELDNVVLSPHIGAQTVDASRDIGEFIVGKVKTTLSL